MLSWLGALLRSLLMHFQLRFGHAADEFQRYRRDYPTALYDRILAKIPEQNRTRAIDLGAGTGIVTGHWVENFRDVISVEPDAGMATKIAEHFPRVTIRMVTAEEHEQPPESIDLISIANALHWMDAGRVMANVELWLRPGGILAICGGRFPRTPRPVREIVRREFHDHWNQFRDSRLDSTNTSEFARAALTVRLREVEDDLIPNTHLLSPGEFAGFCSSTSYGSAYARSVPDSEVYWRDLEERFLRAWPEEKFPVDFNVWLLIAKKE